MSDSGSTQRLVAGVVALIFILVVALGSTAKVSIPPKPVGANAPESEFSAERAMALIEEFAQKPHPLGSLENVRVQGVLKDALEELGYEVFIQDQPLEQGSTISRARNVYARLQGTDSTGAIALCAHFDSVPYGPGAADDGSGVAAIIETARVLKHSEPLKNDVIFLLTDGEENGLLGPRTFLEHNPWRDDLKLVLNFEARGHYGPSMMYLTWPGNAYTMRNFIEGTSHPVTSSVMFDFASALPTSSDYYVFKERGYPGFDLAYVGGLKYYHTPNDSPEKLNMRSLQHHGTYGVSVAKHFGNVDLTRLLEDPDDLVVYFNTFGYHMVVYSAKWIWPVSILALLIAVTALALGLARKRISIGGTLTGVVTFVVPLLASALLAMVPVYFGILRFGPYALYNLHWFIIGSCLLTLAVFTLTYAIAARVVRAESLASGALVLLLPVLIAGTYFLPMGSFMFAWPITGAGLGLLALFLLPRSEGPWLPLMAGGAGALPALVMMSPFVLTLIETFTFLLTPVAMLLAGVMLGLAVLPLAVLGRAPRVGFGTPAVALVLAVCALLPAVFDNRFTPDRPKMNYLLYGANFTEGTAIYATTDRELDEWTEQFFGEGDSYGHIHEFAPFERDEFRLAEAPLADMDIATVEVIEDTVDGDTRRVTVFVQAGIETVDYNLMVHPGVPLLSVTVDGRPWDIGPNLPVAQWNGRIRGRFDEGLTYVFELEGADASLGLTIIEQNLGVPNIEGIRPRPDWMIPMSNTMPVSWDFSRERLLSDNPLNVLQFRPGSRSMHIYARQDFTFAPDSEESESEEAPVPDSTPPQTPSDAV